jgi:hypothetical protein
MIVYVLDYDGTPLMPTKRLGHVRWLLKTGQAVVVKKEPFTIRLTTKKKRYTQDVTLGVDSGSKHIGLSATTSKDELFCGIGELRTNIVDLLSTRRETRRTRRSRLRYRKSRFLNRIKSKKPGWIASSVQNKIQFHFKLIDMTYSILPITKLIIEVGSFDPQKINNPNISGKEYQEGPQKDFWNIREYVLFRDNHTCQHCKGRSGDKILNVHHIESRKIGGNSPGNLITLCKTCHNDYHKGKIKLSFKRSRSLRDAATMNIMKNYLLNEAVVKYNNVFYTWGYITKYNRIQNGIPKDHDNDAFIISENFGAKLLDYRYIMKQVRRHNRQIHKFKILKGGKLKKNQASYKVCDYRLNDIVRYKGEQYYIGGRRSSGYFDIRTFDGNKLNTSYKNLKLCRISSRLIMYNKKKESTSIPPTAKAMGILEEVS